MKPKLFSSSFIVLSVLLLIGCQQEGIKPDKNSEIFNLNEPLVSVSIINTLDEIKMKFYGNWIIDGEPVLLQKNDGLIVRQVDGFITLFNKEREKIFSSGFIEFHPQAEVVELEIADVPYGVGWWWEGKENRKYEGIVSIFPGPRGKPEVIVTLPMEEYLKGVVPYEIGGDSPLEALKAQAVAARSEAVIALKSDLYRGPNHDLTSDVECQVFSGNNRRTQYSDQAVDDTRGIILTSEGEPINAYYASNCGGHSELLANVWKDRPVTEPYTIAKFDTDEAMDNQLNTEEEVISWIDSEPDVYCNPRNGVELPEWSRTNFRWEREYDRAELTKMLNPEGDFGNFKLIEILKRGESGRIIEARIVFEKGEITTSSELELRQLFNPSLRSSCFYVIQEKNRIVLKGAGWGHGVGMCQSGAVAMAHGNSTFQEILSHYYTNAVLNLIY